MSNIIKTQRLEIRPYEGSDIILLSKLLANSEIAKTFMLPSYDTAKGYEALARKLFSYSHSDERFERGIYLDNVLIGFVNDVRIEEDVIEMGYVIAPEYKGNGYATEMFNAVISTLFSMGYKKIVTGAFEENIASIRVMQKCKMIKTNFTDYIEYHGAKKRCVYYEISK